MPSRVTPWMGTMSVMASTRTWDSLQETAKRTSAGLQRWPSSLLTQA
ncbi:hypothetical protein LEMLEM_LOCUS3499 [Lemmus lemmus]